MKRPDPPPQPDVDNDEAAAHWQPQSRFHAFASSSSGSIPHDVTCHQPEKRTLQRDLCFLWWKTTSKWGVLPPRPPNIHSAATSDLAKYLMRREMVSSGLLKFDNQPENYWAWKTFFQSAVQGLVLTPQDLQSKWLGPQSAAQAKRIRAAYIHIPNAGLNMVWKRLEDCFGAPKIKEHALLKKIEDFPKNSKQWNPVTGRARRTAGTKA